MSLFALSLRSVLRGWRVAAISVLPLLVGLVALLLRLTADGADRTPAYGTLVGRLLLPLVLALVALVLGVNAFGDERDEQTLGFLLTTTAPRWRLVLAKYVAAALAVWVLCLPATLGCALLGGATSLPGGQVLASLLAGTLLSAAAYTALFLLLSLLFRRALIIGLAYLVLWERLLAGNTTTFRNGSVGSYASRVGGAPYDDPPFSVADTSVLVAVVILVVVSVGFVAAAAWRLPRTHQ